MYFITLFILLIISNLQNCEEQKGGTINDLFSNEESEFHSETYEVLKTKIEQEFPEVKEAKKYFSKVLRKLSKQLQTIEEKGNSVIPILNFERIQNNGGVLPEGVADKIKKRGVVIVRNTIPKEEIEEMMADLITYMYDNEVYPSENQTVYEIYWSKPQIQARQHKNMMLVQKALLGLWHTRPGQEDKVDADLTNPAMYIDRLRIRPPGDSKFTLPPHMDGGGIERWKDDNYRAVYRHILNGNFEDYDPFEIDYRVEANMNDFGYANGCTFFRAFQGWLSLSNQGPGKGTLRVLPLIKEATAYWMLRPFLEDVPRDLFPGCFPGKTFHISNTWHPELHKALVSIPDVGPGDSVWWHADLIHSVEKEHNGNEHSSVFYIPSGPDCRINRDYLRRMRHTFAAGKSPPDFPVNDYEVDFRGRATLKDLTGAGRKAMGWPPIEKSNIVDENAESCKAE